MPKSKSKKQDADTSEMNMAQMLVGADPKFMQVWLELMNDSARFVADRLQKDQETQMALINCKTPADLVQVQSAFFKDAFEQYTEQTSHMLEKLTGVTAESLKATTWSQSRRYDDVPM